MIQRSYCKELRNNPCHVPLSVIRKERILKYLVRKNESSLLYKVYKLELEMLEGDNNQPVRILSRAGEVK